MNPETGHSESPGQLSLTVEENGEVMDVGTSNDFFLEGEAWWLFLPAGLRTELESRFKSFAASGVEKENISLTLEESERPLEVAFSRILNCCGGGSENVIEIRLSGGALSECIAITREVEGRYRRKYKELNEKLKLLMSSARQICWDWNMDTQELRLMGPLECVLDYDYGEIADEETFWWDRVHPADLERVQESLEVVRAGSSDIWEVEHRLRDANGIYQWVKQSGRLMERYSGKGDRLMVGSTRVVDQRKQAEMATTRILDRYRAIVEAQGDAIARIDNDGRIRFMNTSFSQRFLEKEQRDGRPVYLEAVLANHPYLKPFVKELARMDREVFCDSFLTEHERGGEKWSCFAWNVQVLEDESTGRREAQFSGRDMSMLKSLEEALLASNKANEAKDQFLAMISHDLRTPLNPIMGFAELLSMGNHEKAEVQEMASKMLKAGKQLYSHIESLLELSQMDSDTYLKEQQMVSLRDLRDEYETTFCGRAEKKGLAFAVVLAGDRGKSFLVDLKLLRNVLNNLVENAIKFTKEGQVLLKLAYNVSDSLELPAELRFEVIDEGPGIPNDQVEKVFAPFYRMDTSREREEEGAGLGLSICKRAMGLLEGKLEVLPNRRKSGMTFRASIPVTQYGITERSEPPLESEKEGGFGMESRMALIVDDIESNRNVLRAILKELGVEAVSCSDGLSALDELSRRDFDIVFTDIHMPCMNGVEMVKRLRSDHNSRKCPYVAAVTADVTPGLRREIEEVGIDNYATKPISTAKIRRVLKDFQLSR